jgi:DNA polymerase I
LYLKNAETNEALRLYDFNFEPYYYHLPREPLSLDEAAEKISRLTASDRRTAFKAKRVETTTKIVQGKQIKLLKIFAEHPTQVPALHQLTKKLGTDFEHRIAWVKRYLIDKSLSPCGLVECVHEGEQLHSIKPLTSDEQPQLNALAFDIETYNPSGVPNPAKDPMIMLSWATRDHELQARVLTFKPISKPFIVCLDNEKSVIENFCSLLRRKRVDLLCGYNSDVFDLPYLAERAKKLKARFWPGRTRNPPRTRQHGLRAATSVDGRIHFDVFSAVSFLDAVGAVKLPRLNLETAYAEILGKKKPSVKKFEIHKAWDAGGEELEYLAEYSLGDAIACLELAEYVLPLEIQLSRLSGETLFDASRSSASQLVESLLMRQAFQRGEIIPNKPTETEATARASNPVEGAFVKTPEPGIYENIAVLDYKSLYPSIIISHNIDPSTLDCDCCAPSEQRVSPQGHKFCAKKRGLIPSMLVTLLDARARVKKEMKNHSPDSPEYKALNARQTALKILANATYGYLGYARSRWYSRECAESTTAWARHYIHETISEAEKNGFKVIYADTDSCFLQYEKGREERVEEFRRHVNSLLPEHMELELEDYYPRGIFVAKKQGEKGAKKKYALISREGRIKIRGFELVRRDWSRIARHTQRQVLEILLREGDVAKAKQVVRKAIQELREGKTPLEDCVMLAQLRKKVKAYEVMSPEIAAFLKAKRAGLHYDEYSVIPFIITKNGKSISDKAQPVELAKDYDADYYVNNQVLPAVLKILGALNIDADELATGGKQKSLGEW